MDAVTAITNDHRVMEGLFERLTSGQGDKTALVTEVKARLLAHSKAEEEHVYPALVRNDPGEKGDVHHGVEEHREAEEKLRACEAALGTTRFAEAVTEFVDAVTHHVEEEESDILPALKDAVGAGKLDELGETFEKRRLSELKAAGFDDTLTKDELYKEARDAEVPGRSTMSKGELREELHRGDRP